MSIIKNTYYSSINIYFEYIVGLIISVLIARSLMPNEYGVYSYLVKLTGIGVVFIYAGISTGAIKFIAELRVHNNTDQIAAVFQYFQRILRIKTSIVIVLIFLVHLMWPGLIVSEEYEEWLVFLLGAIAFKSAHMYRVSVFKGYERFDFLAFSILLVAPVNLALVLIGLYFQADAVWYFLIFSVVTFFYWIFSGYFLRKLSVKKENPFALDEVLKLRVKKHLKIVSVNSVLTGLVIGQCEVLLLNHLVNSEAVAYFVIGATIASALLSLVPGVYSSVLFPVIARSVAGSGGEPGRKIKDASRYLFMLSVMVAIPTVFNSDHIIALLYGESYEPAGLILAALTVAGITSAFRDPVSAYFMSIDKQSVLLKISCFSLIFSLLINYILIVNYGLEGVIISYATISVVLMFFMLIMANIYLSILPDMKRLLSSLVAALPAIWLASYLSSLSNSFWMVALGYAASALTYLIFLIVFGALRDVEYNLISAKSKNLPFGLPEFIQFLINCRIKAWE